MNTIKFRGLILMMLLSIIGIIWVQIVWISNAVTTTNANFNNAVIMALNNAANDIEQARKMNFFNNFMLTSSPGSLNSGSINISGYLSIGNYGSVVNNKLNVKITNQTITGNNDSSKITTVNKSYSFDGNKPIISDSTSYVVAKPDESGKMNIVKGDDDFLTDSRAVYIKQNEFLEWVKKRSDEFKNMSDQMIAEIYQWEKTLELDNKEMLMSLRRSLGYANIETPFEYAIIKNGVIQDGTFKKAHRNDFLKSKYKVQLFRGNLIRQDLVLSVIFPEKTNYVLGGLVWFLGGSLLFSLFILATFSLSLYFIIRQKKISEMKSDFINNMTHEFKTPIATISLAADTITNPKVINDENSVRHFIGMIKKENSRMNKKVETILQIASLDKKEIEFRFESVSVHSIIHHSVDTIDIQVQQRNGKINLRLDAVEPDVYGDNEHLTNLVNNLIDNAIKYSPESPEITVTTKNVEKGLVFTVEDKGIGMTKAVQSKIFERFYRQSSGNVHDVKGFGLGLNYSRAIIDAHKGNITVYSEPGKGSRFEVFLPFNPDN
jgi:two-component system, OmpR family, phosphate regulon sensor histidine kinase PhoR